MGKEVLFSPAIGGVVADVEEVVSGIFGQLGKERTLMAREAEIT
jgi:hypothetical protein